MSVRLEDAARWGVAAGAAILAGRAAWDGRIVFAEALLFPSRDLEGLGAHWAGAGIGLLWAALLWLAARAGGRTALRWLRYRARPVALVPAAGILAGFALSASTALAMGLCGLLFKPVAIGLIAGQVAAELGRRAGRARARPSRAALSGVPRLARAGALALGCFAATYSLTPETWVDAAAYHLAAPADFNDEHKWIDVHQDSYRFPLLPEALYGQAMLLGGERAAGFTNVWGAILVGWMLFAVAEAVAPGAGWIAVAAWLASDQIGFHLGHLNEGFFSTAFGFLGVWIWFVSLRAGRGPGPWLAGALLGWALCAKYTAVAPLAGVAAWELVRFSRDPRGGAGRAVALAIGFAGGAGPFLAKGWLFTGNPVYPLVWGGLAWSEENTAALKWFGCPGTDFSPGNPGSLLAACLRFVAREAPVACAGLAWAGGALLRPWGPLWFAWGGAVAVWSVASPCLRLMLPVYPVVALAGGAALAARLAGRGAMPAAVPAVAAFIAGAVLAVAGADHQKGSLGAALGLEPGVAYRTRVLTTYIEAARVCRDRIPAGRPLIVLGDIRGYHFRRITHNRDVEDTPFALELSRDAGSPERMRIRLRQTGASHLITNFVTGEYLAGLRPRFFAWPVAALVRYREMWGRWATQVWVSPEPDGVNGGFALYRLERRPRPPPAVLPMLPGAAWVAARWPDEDDAAWTRRLEALNAVVPAVVHVRARLAARLLAAGRAAEVPPLLRPCLGVAYPEEDALWGLIGVALHRTGRRVEGEEALERAIALRPNRPEYRRVLAAMRQR